MPDLYIRQLESQLADALAAVERVRALHRPVIVLRGRVPCACGHDGWPCPTLRALDGDGTAEEGSDR